MARLSTAMSLSGERPMPMGLPPIGTTFTTLLSNMRLSFAILLSSCGAVAARILSSRPTAQPGKPTLGYRSETHHDHRNVVCTTVFVGERDKFFGRPIGIRFRLQRSRNFRLGDH